MKHLSGALLALTVAPMAVVLAQASSASATTLAACAGTEAALSAHGSTAAIVRASAAPVIKRTRESGQLLSGRSHQGICAPTATPSVPDGSGTGTDYTSTVTDHLGAGSSQDLAAETGSDIRLGTPSGEALEEPESGNDREFPPPPAEASDPTGPGCAEARAAEPDPTDASTGADFASHEEVATDSADATCESGNSVFKDPGHFNRMDPSGQGHQSTDRGAQAGSDASTLPYTGATAATALTFGLGATGGGLLLIAGSKQRRRTTS